jgi:hypothetical protein
MVGQTHNELISMLTGGGAWWAATQTAHAVLLFNLAEQHSELMSPKASAAHAHCMPLTDLGSHINPDASRMAGLCKDKDWFEACKALEHPVSAALPDMEVRLVWRPLHCRGA